MYLAELHGKLSSRLETAEDILTSNVFSFFKYSNRAVFLHQYLRALHFDVSVDDVNNAEFLFWPRFDENTEPDLVIRVGDHYVLFEAKYRSGFGEASGTSDAQLVREIKGGMLEAGNDNRRFSLIGITADYFFKPDKFTCILPEHRAVFQWTNWQRVTAIIHSILEGNDRLDNHERLFAQDLYDLLCKRNLREYGGVQAFANSRYQAATFDVVFFDATTAAFRGDFVGFSKSLSYEIRLTLPPRSIFLNAEIGSRRQYNHPRADNKGKESRQVSERQAFFDSFLNGDIQRMMSPFIFFRRNTRGE
jgi:hypothetical protein